MQTQADLANAKFFTMAKNLARKHNSAALAQIEDPFQKIKGLISDLVTRLEKEVDADATERIW